MIPIEKIARFRIILFVLYLLFFFPLLVLADGIRDTKHNLSGSLSRSPGQFTVKAANEAQICIFCHTPHTASPVQPLWNHEMSSVQTYKTYWSSTLQSYTEPESQAWSVDGYSKLCLSCHDGTIAIGAVSNRTEDILMEASACMVGGRLVDNEGCTGYLGTDLSGGHPISIVFDQTLIDKRRNAGLSNLTIPVDKYVKLYPAPSHGCSDRCAVQCTSCHNPHLNRAIEFDPDDPSRHWPPFWQKETYNAVCLACHEDIPPANIEW